ncbi:MAG: restriction endonuclease subunit S, partial [Acidaminococcaceae bacterium]
MNKLDELINELCPEGVEYSKISEIANISRGVVISKGDILNNIGEYPVYSSQTENNGELGKINRYAYDGEYLTWTTDGANAGTVFYRTGRFSVTNVCGILKIIASDNLARYVFHVLSVEAPKYVRSGMGNPKLMSNVMESIKIPLPPLSVQREIVR